MMQDHFREALETLDVGLARKIWAQEKPNMPQPKTDEEALVIMHIARTKAFYIKFEKRAYSHAWVTERGYPSQLPDHLRPRAERIYPIVVPTVGVATMTRTTLAQAVIKAMLDAADNWGMKDLVKTSGAMKEARIRVRRSFGLR